MSVFLDNALAADGAFGSRGDAEAFLMATLPAVTKANPRYLTKNEGFETIWLTKSIRFEDAPTGGIRVSMDEEYTQYRAGVATPGTHQAQFTLTDVEIAEFTEPGDVTPAGEASKGVLFACRAPQCVTGAWGGQPSKADKSDISIQDPQMRARILAAFLYLKTLSGGAKSPT